MKYPALETLAAGCRNGDRRQMESFYKACLPLMYPVAARYARDDLETKEILNTGMLKIFNALPGFTADHALLPWMRTIIINTGLDSIRKRARHAFDAELSSAAEVWVDDTGSQNLSHEELLACLRKLPETQHAVMSMFAIEGYSHQEIASLLNISESNSRWHLHQARQQLKKMLNHLPQPAF
jgi:RNA polymerase sigma-70 factor (ECF subfamily)